MANAASRLVTAAQVLERCAAPLDVGRRALFGVMLRAPGFNRLLLRKDRRIALIATLHALAALVMAVLVPSLLLVLGPILLGVAHVASDVRHLVLRRRLPGWWKNAVWIGCGSLIALRICFELRLASSWVARAELFLVSGWLVLAALAGFAVSRSRLRLGLAAPLIAGFALCVFLYPLHVYRAFVHVHNLVAVGLWLWLFRHNLRSMLLPLLLIVGGAALLASGVFARTTLFSGAPQLFGLHVLAASDGLAPGAATQYAVGLTSAYAFLQSVHYAVWLIYIPQDDTRAQGTTTFRMTAKNLLGDYGSAGLLAVGLASLAVLAGAFLSPLGTQRLYLSLAFFHGYMELALLAFFFVRGNATAPDVGSAPQPVGAPAGSVARAA